MFLCTYSRIPNIKNITVSSVAKVDGDHVSIFSMARPQKTAGESYPWPVDTGLDPMGRMGASLRVWMEWKGVQEVQEKVKRGVSALT